MRSFIIQIKELRIHANIGATAEEQKLGQSLLIDLQINVTVPLDKDLVSETIDYSAVISCIRSFAEQLGKVKLIETFTCRMLDMLLKQFSAIRSASAKVQKNYVPIENFTGHVCIEMERLRVTLNHDKL